jgi:hypothetical protein
MTNLKLSTVRSKNTRLRIDQSLQRPERRAFDKEKPNRCPISKLCKGAPCLSGTSLLSQGQFWSNRYCNISKWPSPPRRCRSLDPTGHRFPARISTPSNSPAWRHCNTSFYPGDNHFHEHIGGAQNWSRAAWAQVSSSDGQPFQSPKHSQIDLWHVPARQHWSRRPGPKDSHYLHNS